MPRRRRLPLACALLLATASCATTVGTVAGPIAAPISFWNNTYGTPGWVKALLIPLVIPIGPVIGLAEGARADFGAVKNGEYGVNRSPAFEIVWDPLSREYDHVPPLTDGPRSGGG